METGVTSGAARGRVVPWLVLMGAGAGMLWWSWLRWPDPQFDFGLQLYIPWQINRGRVLYRDLAYLNGPLSPYVDALWFRLFGTSLLTLAMANLAILAAVTAMLYALLRDVADRFAATVACLTLLLLFGFGQLVMTGNYNWVCPYSHDLTHGIALSLLGLTFLRRFARRPRPADALVCGLCLGLVFLTKPEVFVAAAAADAVGMAALLWVRRADVTARRGGGGGGGAIAACLLAGLAAPAVVAYLLLRLAMPARAAAAGVAGAWPAALDGRVRSLHFYGWVTGTQDAAGSLGRMGLWSAGYAAVVGLAVAAGRAGRGRRAGGAVAAAVGGAVIAAAAVLWASRATNWLDAARPLPVVMAAVAAVAARRLFRREVSPAGAVVLVALTAFAGVLLGKIILFARLHHYGFALAMPAALLAVTAAVGWLPAWVGRRGGSAVAARAVACGAWAAAVAGFLLLVQVNLAKRVYPVGEGGDLFWGNFRALRVGLLLKELDQRSGPADTVAALPEVTMINYLSRRPNPTPYAFVQTPEAITYGEDAIVAAYEKNPPDWFVIPAAAMRGDALVYEGDSYGRKLLAWVRAHYAPVVAVDVPNTDDNALVLFRRDPSGAAGSSSSPSSPPGAAAD